MMKIEKWNSTETALPRIAVAQRRKEHEHEGADQAEVGAGGTGGLSYLRLGT